MQLSFLVDMGPEEILKSSIYILYQIGWRYNKYQLGEYSYWLNAPIYKFGDSLTKVEDELYEELDEKEIDIIINEMSSYYSPSILLGMEFENRVIKGRLSIFEIENNDLKEIIFTLDNIDDSEWKDLIVNMFNCFVKELECIFGLAGIELGDLVQSMNYIVETGNFSGDIYCVPKKIIQKIIKNSLRLTFHISEIKNNCILIRKENLLELT